MNTLKKLGPELRFPVLGFILSTEKIDWCPLFDFKCLSPMTLLFLIAIIPAKRQGELQPLSSIHMYLRLPDILFLPVFYPEPVNEEQMLLDTLDVKSAV